MCEFVTCAQFIRDYLERKARASAPATESAGRAAFNCKINEDSRGWTMTTEQTARICGICLACVGRAAGSADDVGVDKLATACPGRGRPSSWRFGDRGRCHRQDRFGDVQGCDCRGDRLGAAVHGQVWTTNSQGQELLKSSALRQYSSLECIGCTRSPWPVRKTIALASDWEAFCIRVLISAVAGVYLTLTKR